MLSETYYDAFFSASDEQELLFYQQCINASPTGEALEIACGTGRILLPLLQKGCAVEGFDCSEHMLRICKQKAAKAGLHVTLYQQQMRCLTLPKKYACLFSPLGSFQQVAHVHDAYAALTRFYEHLVPQGLLVIYLYLPWYNAPECGTWHAHDKVMVDDNKQLQVFEKAIHDPCVQQLFMQYRYELRQKDALLEQEEKELVIRWYSRHEFELMLRLVGFTDITVQSGYQNDGPADVMIFVARKAM